MSKEDSFYFLNFRNFLDFLYLLYFGAASNWRVDNGLLLAAS
jgi:hypothetical protein